MSKPARNIFRAALDGFIAARQREADRYVNHALLMFDDETLRSRGYDRAELKKRVSGG